MNEIESWGDMFLIDFITNAEALEHTVRPLELGAPALSTVPGVSPRVARVGTRSGLGSLTHPSRV